MDLQDFKQSIIQPTPPHEANDLMKAMWYDAKNNWHKAHEIVQDLASVEASWIHAYLHRKEGDLGNASYWYHRAGRNIPKISLQQEWEEIVENLLL